MKVARISALALLGVAAIVACSDDIELGTVVPGDDAGSLVPSDSGSPPDEPVRDGGAEAGARACSDDGFCPTPLPGAHDLRAVWGDGILTVWSVSDEGAILRWNGNAWNVHTSSLGPLRAVWGAGSLDVWVGGERGLFHGTGPTPENLTFVAVPLPDAKTKIVSIWGAGPNDVWAVGARVEQDGTETPRVLRYTGPRDAGSSWTVDGASNRGIAYEHVWGDAATGVWLAGTRPQPPPDDFFIEVAVLRRRPGATTWAAVTLPKDPNEDPVFGGIAQFGGATITGDAVFILGNLTSNSPGVWRGAGPPDGGTSISFTYERVGPYGSKPTFAATSFSSSDVWAVGEYGRVRHWDGKTWEQAAIATTKFPIVKDFRGVWSGPKNQLWIVGDDLALRRGVTN